MSSLAGARVVVTGGAGFLGGPVCELLRPYNPAAVLVVPRKAEYDLTEQTAVRHLLDNTRPDVVIHLAAVVGGIGANRAHPGRFFYDNTVMGVLLMREAHKRAVRKFVPDPVNLDTGREVTIKALAELICELCRYRGKLRWDPTRPDGQPRRCLDVSRAWDRLGWTATTGLKDGLRETIAWYERARRAGPEGAAWPTTG